MKQITECLDRFYDNKRPLSKKWQARGQNMSRDVLALFHYQHLVLLYNNKTHEVVEEWWEKPADKRGLEAAKEYLKNRFEASGENLKDSHIDTVTFKENVDDRGITIFRKDHKYIIADENEHSYYIQINKQLPNDVTEVPKKLINKLFTL